MADPERFDADPEPTFHTDADPEPTFQTDADPEPTFHTDANPEPTFHTDADPEPTFHTDADPDPNCFCYGEKNLFSSKSSTISEKCGRRGEGYRWLGEGGRVREQG